MKIHNLISIGLVAKFNLFLLFFLALLVGAPVFTLEIKLALELFILWQNKHLSYQRQLLKNNKFFNLKKSVYYTSFF